MKTATMFSALASMALVIAAAAGPASAQAPAWAAPPEQQAAPAPEPAAQPQQTPAPQEQPPPAAQPQPQPQQEQPKQAEEPKKAEAEAEKKEPEKTAEEPKKKKDSLIEADRTGTIYEGRDQHGGGSIIGTSNHVGVSVGYLNLPEVPFDTHYLHLLPKVDMHFPKKNFSFGFNVPINLVLYSPDPDVSMWSIRSKDWDTWRDAAQIIRFIQYGRKFDRLYFNATTIMAGTLGHGFIMRRYIPNVFYEKNKLTVQFDYNHDYAGFETVFSTILDKPVVGFMPFIRPFAWFTKNEIASSISIGATLVVDTGAPVSVRRTSADFPQFTTALNPGRNYYLRFPQGKPMVAGDNSLKIAEDTALFVYGVDAHVKVFKNKNVDIKPYFDWSQMQGAGYGLTAGCHWRFATGKKYRSFFNIRTDFRAFEGNYQPTYFDSFYEIQKYQYVIPDRRKDVDYAKGVYPTKYNEFTSRSPAFRYGYYVDFTYELSKWFGIGFSISDSTGETKTTSRNSQGQPIERGNGDFQIHVDVPLPKYFSLHGTYHKIAMNGFADIVDFTGPNSMFLATMRIAPFNFVGIYATLQESWMLDDWSGLYEMVPSVQAGVDLAYEF